MDLKNGPGYRVRTAGDYRPQLCHECHRPLDAEGLDVAVVEVERPWCHVFHNDNRCFFWGGQLECKEGGYKMISYNSKLRKMEVDDTSSWTTDTNKKNHSEKFDVVMKYAFDEHHIGPTR